MAIKKSATAGTKELREHLVALLTGGSAHASFDDAVKDSPKICVA